MYIWDRITGHCLGAPKGADSKIVNCVQPHPQLPQLLTSGIDHDIKWLTPNGSSTVPWTGLDPTRPMDELDMESEEVSDLREALQRNLQTRPQYLEGGVMESSISSNDDSDSEEGSPRGPSLAPERLISVAASDVPVLLWRLLGVMEGQLPSDMSSNEESSNMDSVSD